MTLAPNKGYRALRHGRYSQGGTEYFLTFCTGPREPGLTSESIAPTILAELRRMESGDVWVLQCAVIMPDHIHLLVQLGEKLPLGKAVARLKSKSLATMKPVGLRWQEGYYDHHMRPNEDRLPVFLYIYLNPYRAKLLPIEAA